MRDQGLADAFILLGMPFDSAEAKQLNKEIFEAIYFAALETSVELAKADGARPAEVLGRACGRRGITGLEWCHTAGVGSPQSGGGSCGVFFIHWWTPCTDAGPLCLFSMHGFPCQRQTLKVRTWWHGSV